MACAAHLGARRRDIVMQFLLEALLLALIAGVIGVLSGVGIAIGLSAAELAAVKITGLPLAVAASVCGLIALIFGAYPALKAAFTDPVRALQGAAS